jgi:hypothetical protein
LRFGRWTGQSDGDQGGPINHSVIPEGILFSKTRRKSQGTGVSEARELALKPTTSRATPSSEARWPWLQSSVGGSQLF